MTANAEHTASAGHAGASPAGLSAGQLQVLDLCRDLSAAQSEALELSCLMAYLKGRHGAAFVSMLEEAAPGFPAAARWLA